jgi:hypothetical protein
VPVVVELKTIETLVVLLSFVFVSDWTVDKRAGPESWRDVSAMVLRLEAVFLGDSETKKKFGVGAKASQQSDPLESGRCSVVAIGVVLQPMLRSQCQWKRGAPYEIGRKTAEKNLAGLELRKAKHRTLRYLPKQNERSSLDALRDLSLPGGG